MNGVASDGRGALSAAKRRRERRLRCHWKHECLSVRIAVAAARHHSSGREGVEGETYDVPRRQKPPPPGSLPAPLSEVAGRQEVLVRDSGKQLIDDLPSVQILDAPMPQMAGTVLDFCRTLDLPVDEQVITMPKFSTERVPQRLVERCFPQLAEQLVEVPTVLSYSLHQQRTAEQIIGFPVPGRGGGARGCLQGLSQGQGSTAVCGAEDVDTPVPHGRGGGARGSLHGLPQGQGSTAVCGAENVDTPVPHGRGRLGGGSLHGLSQGQGSTAVCGAEHVDTPVPHGGDLHGFSQGQGSTALCGADHVDIPVPHGRVGKRGLHGFPEDRVPQRLPLSRPSVLIVEVFKVFLVDRVPQRLPLSRLFLRLLIDRCHEPRFMAVMTSGCA